MWRETLVVGMVGALAACQTGKLTQQERNVQEQAVEARLEGWAKAFSNRQTDSLAGYYDQSQALTFAWPDGDRTTGWEAEAAKQHDFFQTGRQVNLVLQNPTVDVLTTTSAVATFRHAMDVIVGNINPERRYFTGQGTFVFTRENEHSPWVIHAGQMSETPPPAQPSGRQRR